MGWDLCLISLVCLCWMRGWSLFKSAVPRSAAEAVPVQQLGESKQSSASISPRVGCVQREGLCHPTNPQHSTPALQQLAHTGYRCAKLAPVPFGSPLWVLIITFCNPCGPPAISQSCSWLLVVFLGYFEQTQEQTKEWRGLHTWPWRHGMKSHPHFPMDLVWLTPAEDLAVNFYSKCNQAILFGERQQLVNHHITVSK